MNWWVTIIGSICTLWIVMLIDLHTQSIEARNQMAEHCLLSVQEFYVAIQEQIQQMHRCRHDLAKHIQMLEFLQENDQDFLQDYTEKLRAEYQRQKERSTRYCLHEVVNITLLLKEQRCRELELPFSAAVSADSLDMIGNLDWVGLLYNLLDNAIEAGQRIPHSRQRDVSFRLESGPEALVLTVENQIPQGEKFGFSTKKEKKELHGFGLEIIDDILKKYHGRRTIYLNKGTWRLCTRCTIPYRTKSGPVPEELAFTSAREGEPLGGQSHE